MRALLVLLALVSAVGCKQRNPDAAGLLDAPDAGSEEGDVDASGPVPGDFSITCRPSEGAAARDEYKLDVRGAVRAEDEAQAISVTVDRKRATASRQVDRLATAQGGRGSVRLQGTISLGFGSGALTAEYVGGTHEGILTLAEDAEAKALAVKCGVTAR